MSWFEKLKHLIKIDIHDLVNIKINSDNVSEKYEYREGDRYLSVNLEKLTFDEKEEFGPILVESVGKGDITLLEHGSKELIEDIKSKEISEDTQSILSFFKDKIPEDDFEALRGAQYIRTLLKTRFEEGLSSFDTIYRLKGDIIKKYGTRGLNICNLCSSGYFERLIELYKEMEKGPYFSKEDFLESYDIIINESAFAVFVSGDMSSHDVEKAIEGKIKRNLRYGIKFVSIHGIGKENVIKIRQVIPKLENKYPDIDKKIEEEKGVIFAKLRFEE